MKKLLITSVFALGLMAANLTSAEAARPGTWHHYYYFGGLTPQHHLINIHNGAAYVHEDEVNARHPESVEGSCGGAFNPCNN